MIQKPNYDNLTVEIYQSLKNHYEEWIKNHSNENIYAYVIYATSLVSNISVSVLTEEGLMKVVQKYINYDNGETEDQLEKDLRWSVADSPYCEDNEEVFDSINDRLYTYMTYIDSLEIEDTKFNLHINKMYSILVSALNLFRNKVLNNSKTPMLYVDFGDMSDEERLWFIEQCNNHEIVEKYLSTI